MNFYLPRFLRYQVLRKNTVLLLMPVFMYCSSVQAGAFDQGSTLGSIAIGSGQLFQEEYLVVGAGISHYVIDGLEVGLEVDAWTGNYPSIYEVTPKLSFVVDNLSDVKPYLGVFYNRTFIEDFEDSDSYGYRVGFYAPAGHRSYVGIGLVYTDLQDCTETAVNLCSDTYTELSFVFSM